MVITWFLKIIHHYNMKKIKFIAAIALSAITIAANAVTYTATAKITVTAASGAKDVLILLEAPDGSNDFENSKDITKLKNNANDYSINLYAKTGANEMLSTVYTNSLADLAIVFEANNHDEDYTMTFTNVQGTIKLYDGTTGVPFELTNNGTYNFTVAKNSITEGRFQIGEGPAPLPGEPKICFKNEQLIISDALNPIHVEGEDEGMTYNQDFPASTTSIDMSSEVPGHYFVVFETDTLHFNVKPAVTVVP